MINNDIWSQEAERLYPSSENTGFNMTTALQKQAFIAGVLFSLSVIFTSEKVDARVTDDQS